MSIIDGILFGFGFTIGVATAMALLVGLFIKLTNGYKNHDRWRGE